MIKGNVESRPLPERAESDDEWWSFYRKKNKTFQPKTILIWQISQAILEEEIIFIFK